MPMWDESRDGEPMVNPNARPVTRTWRAPRATPPDRPTHATVGVPRGACEQ